MANGQAGAGNEPDPGGGAEGAGNTPASPDGAKGTWRIVQAWNQGGSFACVQAWLDERNGDALYIVGAPEDGRLNDAPGTDPANRTRYWAIRQVKEFRTPKCKAWGVYDWDGATRPLQDFVGGAGPKPYTTTDIVIDTATSVADAAAQAAKDAASSGAGLLELAIGLGIIAFVLKMGGGK